MNAGQDQKKLGTDVGPKKQAYKRPSLRVFGDVQHLTAGGSGVDIEAMAGGPWVSAMP